MFPTVSIMGQSDVGSCIMLVDDDSDTVNALGSQLRGAGFTVDTFTDSESAFEAFRSNQHAYHALVSDVRMPKMSGFELAKKLKQIRPSLRTVMVTGYEINEITLQKLKDTSEVDHVLYKPVRTVQILQLLRMSGR
jgi:FixJ family two-component response regulator